MSDLRQPDTPTPSEVAPPAASVEKGTRSATSGRGRSCTPVSGSPSPRCWSKG